ncbi:aldehyde dehydrogenase family protein [Aquamicrobium lusatiense]|uniref:aldehyde dehydrogenase family protein n=1 Tax=Aquamicrobium lusatiense TaxID=89772 RepID=UPI0024574FD7|nr:aldehyde dehydrogenase family protein [Aquamicrobium lusatiense]MDH4989410.1 aldehyde dehydrogenase family protein [Aquamicrobium lusatiense]
MDHPASSYPVLSLHIAGQWIDDTGNGFIPVFDPATGRQISQLPKATERHLEMALAAAANAGSGWAAVPVRERAALLRAAALLLRGRAETIAAMVTMEQGKPLAEARSEVLRSADLIEWNADAAVALMEDEGLRAEGGSSIALVPVGTVAAFTPWNVPVLSPARKVSMALAAGCACILKPAEETPASAVELVRAFVDAGVPAGVLGLVFGDPASISDHLIRSPVIRKVTFTGSVPVGKHLAALAGSFMKPVTMELGGHNPVLILQDADVRHVAKAAAMGKFRNAGQICTSPTRFYVHTSQFDDFVEAFAAETAALRIGNGLEADVQMGPVASERRLTALQKLVSETLREGAKLIAGGARIGEEGYFYAPTLLTDIGPDSTFMREEPFGPVAGIFPYDTTAEGLALCNASSLGLAAYVFGTSDAETGKVASGMESGIVGINSFSVSRPDLPFGGVKDSGYGREGGIEGLKAFLVTRVVAR